MCPDTNLRCRCGAVELTAGHRPIMSTECHCTSCRTAAEVLEALPGAPSLRAPTGGIRTEMYRKDRVFCIKGAENLREYRLTPDAKTRRVVAICCNTPVLLDFTEGHWVDLYATLWPEGSLPPLQMRTMTGDISPPATLPGDVPNHKAHSAGFYVRLIAAWVAMGFARPTIDYVDGALKVGH